MRVQGRIVKVAWLITMTSVLLWGLIDYWEVQSKQMRYEVGLKFLIVISGLSLPLGPALLFIVVSLIGLRFSGIYELIEIWLICLVAGYLQWFELTPRLYQAISRK